MKSKLKEAHMDRRRRQGSATRLTSGMKPFAELSEDSSESEEVEEKEKNPIVNSYHFGDTSSDEEKEKKEERKPKY